MPLARRTDYGDSRFCGCEVRDAQDAEAELAAAVSGGFDFLVVPLVRQLDAARAAVTPPSELSIPDAAVARSEFLQNSSQVRDNRVRAAAPAMARTVYWPAGGVAQPPSTSGGEV